MNLDRIVIIGAGNSIRPELKNGLWNKLGNEITFALNDVIYFFEPTIPIFVDWYWYKARAKKLEEYDLVIGKWDIKIGSRFHECDEVGKNIILLQPSNNEYQGIKSWKNGFYSGVLCGCFALTLAICLGFKEIYLLGYDFGEINGKTHFYQKEDLKDQKIGIIKEKGSVDRCGIGKDKKGNYRTGVYNNNAIKYFEPYKEVSKEIKIFNVSVNSRINIFPKITYEEFYQKLKNKPVNINHATSRTKIKNFIEEKIK